MQRLFRLLFGPHQEPQTAPAPEDAPEQLAELRASILRTVRSADGTVDEFTNLSRWPHWQRAEWAATLSTTLRQNITAADIAEHRTVRGLAHQLHRNTLSDTHIATMRAHGL